MTDLQNALLKSETIRQLKIRRDTLEQTQQFAQSKINALPEESLQVNEFVQTAANCEIELAKINGCIKLVDGIK